MAEAISKEPIEAYAAAIFEIGRAEGELEKVERELLTIAQTFTTSNELRDALTNPQLSVERKQGIIDDLIGGRASSLTVGLVSFIVGQGRASELPAIVDAVVNQAAASRAKAVAEIRSAVPLDDSTLERLVAVLARVTGKELEVKAIVDPDLVGGVVARVGDVVIDGSVARRLAEMRQVLTNV
ncbi:MAG TPA: ATP synthase F1 subunit delta [Acidimicrobiia bacterium]|nr:ATP synthase F1 subunit delta [Acidimicrobiia bacterium]